MFEVEFESVFAILKLLPIIRLQRWSVKVEADCCGFIGDSVAFGTYSESEVGVVLAGQFLIPSACLLDDRFFKEQVHGGDASSIFSYAIVAVFKFVPDASCPGIIGVPGFDAAADSCYLWLG